MPRTFSLARLLLAITAFCFLCRLALSFPGEAMIAVLPIPTLIVYYALLVYSRHPLQMTIAALTGALIGFLYCNTVGGLVFPFVIPKPAVNQEVRACLFVYSHVVYITSVAITPAIGALIFGGAFALYDRLHRSLTAPTDSLTSTPSTTKTSSTALSAAEIVPPLRGSNWICERLASRGLKPAATFRRRSAADHSTASLASLHLCASAPLC